MRRYPKEKVVYLPGWLDLAELHPEFYGLEIWKQDIDPGERIETEYLVGNSLGCHFALLNWERNRNTKLILINPLLEKRLFLFWMWRWVKFALFEGWKHFDLKKAGNSSNLFKIIGLARKFLSDDYWDIIKEMPPKDVLVIRGEKDHFFCDRYLARKIRLHQIPFQEISGMGHAWEDRYVEELDKFIS
jgi:hypothetical protein